MTTRAEPATILLDDASDDEERYRYGWRYVREQHDDQIIVRQVSLTCDDVLHYGETATQLAEARRARRTAEQAQQAEAQARQAAESRLRALEDEVRRLRGEV